MKQVSILILFIVLAGLLYISENDITSYKDQGKINTAFYQSGILKSEHDKVQRVANYNISVELNADRKFITAQEEIVWINKTKFPAKEIQFHFYPNAYKSDKTLFAKAYPINSETRTQLDIKTFLVNGDTASLIYFQPDIANPYDSTVAKVLLNTSVQPGDSIKIYFEYSMKIPRSVKRMGYATGRNFFFVSQWFPKVGVFENGKWTCSQYHPYLNFYSDFGDYSIKIKVPKDYIVASTGAEIEKTSDNQSTIFHFVQFGVHDFVWMASDEILHHSEVYSRHDGSQITIHAFVQPEREKYIERYFQCVKNCLKYFEDHIGIYPYQNVTLVDVPRTSASGGMEYPTLFTVSAELFSPQATGWPEYLVAHEFSHQFFQGLIANNEVYEAWLDEGFASYLATKIMYYYKPEILENFKFASYIPIYGLNFLSYNEIPMIYTLAEIQIPEGARSASNYYNNLRVGSIADTSYKLPTRVSYVNNAYNKPELVLLTLERYVGSDKMMEILKDYYNNFKYKHTTGKDFIKIVQNHLKENMDWFWDEFYFSSKIFDYKITSLKQINNNTYEVLAEREGDGFFKNEIALYTDCDTLYQKWNTNERWKIFTFKTSNKVIAAEIDPNRKNLLDINFANNSFTLETRVWSSLSLAIRLFFWVQNALMILGSI